MPDSSEFVENSGPLHGWLNEAALMTPFDLDDPAYAQEMVISIGGNFESKKWKAETLPVWRFVDLLSRHPENPKKDGLAFVLAEIAGPLRRKIAVKACYGVALDIDVGTPGAVIDDALARVGCLAIRYTSHSNGKTKNEFRKDRLVKFADEIGGDLGDPETIFRFLREKEQWDEALVQSAEYVGDEHRPEGLMAQINHAPMPKNRVVVPFAEPLVITEVAKTQDEGMRLWNQVPKALARALGDLPLDKAALDPSRLFYFPRHANGRPHETTIFGGPLLDWRTLDLDGAPVDAWEAALARETGGRGARARSTTDDGRAFARWSIKAAEGFQIADVIRDHAEDRIRTPGSTKIDVECPFDEEHSNAGDPEDRGCFAVNAGDGPSPVFTIKCAHDSCQERTNLDMLGKMIRDGWFSEEVLEDPDYNALDPDPAENQAPPKLAGADVLAMIDALDKDSAPDAINAVIGDMSKLTDRIELGIAKKRLKRVTGMNMADIDPALAQAKRQHAGAARHDFATDDEGYLLFEYQAEFDDPDAVKALRAVTLRLNQGDGGEPLPLITYGVEGVTKMDRGDAGEVIFSALDYAQFHAASNMRMAMVKLSDDGIPGPRKHVPVTVAKTFYNTAHHDLPATPEIVRVPIFTADGRLLRTEGWHLADGLNVYMETGGLVVGEVRERPTGEEVAAALKLLREDLLGEFPFLDFDADGEERPEPSEAMCLAMLITPFARRMIDGQTPVFWVTKPVPGTGGTVLGEVPGRLFEGRDPPRMSYTPGNDEENRKELVTACRESRSVLFFDDVKVFNARPYIQAITSPTVGGRLLGKSESVQRPNNFLWCGTGNNTYFGEEMERRVVPIRLNAKTADIQTRTFKRKNFRGWVLEERGELIRAILTLIQHWIAQKSPPFEERSLTSFEAWARVVGGVLAAAGVTDFLNARRTTAADPAYAANRQFVTKWRNAHRDPIEVGELAKWGIAGEYDVVEGRDELEKRRRLISRLNDLNGQTFNLGDEKLPDLVTVKQTAASGELHYELVAMDPAPAQAPADD